MCPPLFNLSLLSMPCNRGETHNYYFHWYHAPHYLYSLLDNICTIAARLELHYYCIIYLRWINKIDGLVQQVFKYILCMLLFSLSLCISYKFGSVGYHFHFSISISKVHNQKFQVHEYYHVCIILLIRLHYGLMDGWAGMKVAGDEG